MCIALVTYLITICLVFINLTADCSISQSDIDFNKFEKVNRIILLIDEKIAF